MTLLTIPDQNSLSDLTLKFSFYTVPYKQWNEFVQFLVTFPGLSSLQRVRFSIQTNGVHVEEARFGVAVLRGRGWEATVSLNEGNGTDGKRPFPFYLYSRF